jgi:hypothetical protein
LEVLIERLSSILKWFHQLIFIAKVLHNLLF